MSDEFQELALSDFLKTRIKDLIADHKDHLANGTIKDHEEYKRLCGIIEGLNLAEREMAVWSQTDASTPLDPGTNRIPQVADMYLSKLFGPMSGGITSGQAAVRDLHGSLPSIVFTSFSPAR